MPSTLSRCGLRAGSRAAYAALLFSPLAAFAQVGTAPEAQAPAELEAVTVRGTQDKGVTAKQATVGVLGDLPLIETPFSVNVITRALLDRQQATFLGDFLKNDPSAVVGNVAVPFATLRGFAIGTDGLLYDGLPGHGALSDGRAGMQSIERIETLKGASAFLYGQGAATSLGGVINYIPKRPTDQPLRSAAIGYTNRSLLSVEADVGDRFGSDRQFGYRVNLGHRDGEQAVEHYDWTQKVAAVALDWRAAPGLVFNLGLDYVENNNPRLPPFYAVGTSEVPAAPDARRSAALSWDDFKTRNAMQYLRADWAINADWTLTAQGLRSANARPRTKEARFGFITDADGSIQLFGSEDESQNDRSSGQLLLNGRVATGSLRHRLSLGASGFRDSSEGGSAPLGAFASNLYRPVDAPEPASALGALALTSRTRGSSLLASDLVDFNDQWSALIGARHARLKVENVDTGAGDGSVNEATRTLPAAALMFKPGAGMLIYLNYAEGLEQGGAVSPTNQNQFLPPIRTKQVELGAKWEREAMSLTAALFDMRRPLEQFDAGAGQNVQRGHQRHRGVELIANGRITPELTLVAGAMLLDTSLSDTGDAASDGKRAIGVPRYNANLWGEYRIAAIGGLSVQAGVYHAARQYLDGANTLALPSWTRIDLGAGYETRIAGHATTLLLTVENAADKSYWASAQSGILTLADPRTVKVGARVSF